MDSKPMACLALALLLGGCRVLPSHFSQFELREPTPAATVASVGESCSATAENRGTVPAGYRRTPTSLVNCTDYRPEELLEFSWWDGVDPRALPNYDITRTCYRLDTRFRDAARRLAATGALLEDLGNLPAIKEAVVHHMEDAAVLYYWNLGDNFPQSPINGLTPEHASAMADLAVTGHTAYLAFVATRPVEEGIGETDRQVRVEAVRAKILQQSPGHVTDDNEIRTAIDSALDRVYQVAWALRGPVPVRAAMRSALGYIGVYAMADPPHRPVNVYSPDISLAPEPVGGGPRLPDLDVHQQDTRVSVTVTRGDWSLPEGPAGSRRPQLVTLRTRYLVIVDRDDGLVAEPAAAFAEREIPPATHVVLPDNYDVVLLLHGHSSRAEEAMDLARPLIQQWRNGGRKLAVLVPDLPSNGYTQMLDHRRVADVQADGSTVPSAFVWHDGSFMAYFPVLDFIEQSVVDFVEQLNRWPYPGLRNRIKAVVGGSLGGNLGLRLSRRHEEGGNRYPYLQHIVSWSPASTWGNSWARARLCSGFVFDCLVTLSESGTYSDTAKHEAVRSTRDKYQEYTERGNGQLAYFLSVFTTSSTLPEAVLQNMFPAQGERWYRPGWPCKRTYLKSALLDRWEIYNPLFRTWHWRVAHEQLLFMHNEPSLARRRYGVTPSYERFRAHLLLAAGAADNAIPEKLYDNTRELAQAAHNFHRDRPAPKLTGHTLWLEDTGHSIHNERPNFLARTIWQFLYLPRP